ncbi:MAG: dTDP-4-dehydrorhamnose reductase [Anaerolineales bacterium]|nr:dTDP-4-dehydrorhamnose reductase [Anaerolineales bacterium]
MDILLFGRNGQLGWELARCLAPLGKIEAIDKEDLDLTDQQALESYVLHKRPHLIVNATAYTNVDGAQSEHQLAHAINEHAPATLAKVTHQLNAALVHFSTDYVFNGQKGEPYTEQDPPDPLNVYGKSKLDGETAIIESECAHLIFRTSWVYSFRQPSFPGKVLEWARTQDQLMIVDDQIGSPTWARMLAEATALVLAMGRSDIIGWVQEKTGLFHLAGRGACSRQELASQTLQYYEKMTGDCLASILPAKSEEFPSPAVRPSNPALDCTKFERTFGLQLPPWQESLQLALASHLER